MQSVKAVRKKGVFGVEEQPIIIKLWVFVIKIANKHDENDTNNNIKDISLLVTSLQVTQLIFGCSIDRRKGTRLTCSVH